MAEGVRAQLLEMIREITGRDIGEIAGDGDLTHAYGLDSIQSVLLMSRIERRYGLVFGRDPEDMMALASIDSLSRWVQERA
jgi:acyl carrier protein